MALFVPKDRRSLFRQFLAGMYDAVVITDPNGHILEINPRSVEYFGQEREDVLDRPISIFIPGLKTDIVGRIRKGLEGDRHVVIDANALAKDGRKIACEVTVSAIDLLNPGDLIFTIRNVERRRAFLSSLRSRANAFEHSPAGLFACDAEGCIREANPAFLAMFDLADQGAARQRKFSELMEDAPLAANFEKALAGEHTVVGVVADGDGDDEEELEITLGPDVQGRKTVGVVGSIIKQ